MKSSNFRLQDIKMLSKFSTLFVATTLAVSLSACDAKPGSDSTPTVTKSITVESPAPSKWDVFSSKLAGVYVVNGDDYSRAPSQGLKEANSSHMDARGTMKYIDGNLLTVTTDAGKAAVVLKGKSVDRISARSVALTTGQINLAFVGDAGSKASFGKSLSLGEDYVVEETDKADLTRVTFNAVQDDDRVLKDVVLTARIDGEYVYVPLNLK